MSASTRSIVWIASYPKSGNTWIRILLGNYLGRTIDGRTGVPAEGSGSADRAKFDDVTGLASSDLTAEETDLLRPDFYRHLARDEAAKPWFVKVHDAFQLNRAGEPLFPAESSLGALVVVRHPFDVAVSYQHHLAGERIEAVVRRICDPMDTMGGKGRPQIRQLTKGWSGHYLSWVRQGVIPALVVRYEDMLADTSRELARILAFAGLPLDHDRITESVAQSRFERLQAIEARYGFHETPALASCFFRSGRMGEGVESLPPDLRRRIVDTHGSVMAELGYSALGVEFHLATPAVSLGCPAFSVPRILPP